MTIAADDIDALQDIAIAADKLHALVYDLTDPRSSDRMVKYAANVVAALALVLSLAPNRLTERHACPACGDGYYRHQTIFPHTSDSPVYRMCDTCGHKGKLEWPGGQPPKKRKR